MSGLDTMEFPCKIQGCKSKPLKSSKTFETHMKRQHPNTSVGENSSSPTSPTSPTSLPTPAPTLLLSTPADSPPLPDQDIDEMYNDNEWLEAVAEEVELMIEMEQMTEEEMEVESSKDEVINKLKEKMERFKTIADKKSNVVKSLKEVKENLTHDIKLRKEVEIEKEKKIDELDDINKGMRNQLKQIRERNLVILVDQKKMKKYHKEHEIDLKSLRDVNSDLIKTNTTLKLEISRKDDLIMGLKEVGEIADEDNEIEVEAVQMDNETSGTICLICNKKFPVKKALDQHMQAKHNQGECPICDESFPIGSVLTRHTNQCMVDINEHECPECKNKFLTNKSLKIHITKNHRKDNHPNDKFSCTHCEMIFKSEIEMKKHTKSCKDNNLSFESEKSKVVCRHWRRGNCTRGDACGFSHVGHQLTPNSEVRSTKPTDYTPACKHGLSCKWLAKGSCSYFHNNVGVQKPWTHKEKQNQPHNSQPRRVTGDKQSSGRPECKYGAKCNKVPNCTFLHSLADFPNLLKENQQYRTVKNSNRKQ